MTKKDLKESLAEMSDADLMYIKNHAHDLLIDRCADEPIEFPYTELTTQIQFLPKFSGMDNHFAPWYGLSPANKKTFKKSYLNAIHYFTDRGYKDNNNLKKLIFDLIVNGDLLYKPLFQLIVDSLDRIEYLYDRAFPELRAEGGEWLLQEQLQYGN